MMKFKLFLYKYLGKFIAYFKRKFLIMNNLNIINQTIIAYMASHNHTLFAFPSNQNIPMKSDQNLFKIEYSVRLSEANLHLFFVYNNGNISNEIIVNLTTQTPNPSIFSDIQDVYNLFRSFNTTLLITEFQNLNSVIKNSI